MTLKELCGEHVLQGVEYGTVENKDAYAWEDKCGCFKFMLDGVTYCAVEDPDDGYRSYCRDIYVDNTPPRFRIPDTKVIGSMKEDDQWGRNDILVLRDVKTGEVVLEVGTAAYTDYYPAYVAEWHPENLSCNYWTDGRTV